MPRNTTRKTVELDGDNVDWYYKTFPGGSLSGMLDQLLQNLREVIEHTPDEYARIAAETLAEELKK
jgi:hypothetical protein